MKSQSGMAIQKFVVLIVVLVMILGATVYVVFQDNGIYEREVKPLVNNLVEEARTTQK